jgi:hypothetical protein
MRNSLFMILFLLHSTANGQSPAGFEAYYYTGHRLSSALVSRIYYQVKGSWYGEARYNYEAEQSVSLYAGRTFSKKDSFSYAVTPLAGLVTGKLKGGSVGMNITLDYRKVSFSSALEYSFSEKNKYGSFFFNWSELGYQVTKHIYAGLALQQTCVYNTTMVWEPGIEAGISFGKWLFPVYAFNPAGNKKYFVLGIAGEWEHGKRH